MLRRISALVILCLLLGAQRTQAQLTAHAEVNQTGAIFAYTLFNDELVGSPNFLSLFHLDVNAPITVTSTPTGWDFVTDNSTYVDWFNTDTQLPYPNDVAPGSSLSGFTIESTVSTSESLFYTVNSWDHGNDTPGPATQSLIGVPSVVAAADPTIPEPSTLTLLGAGTVTLLGFVWRRKLAA